MRNVTGGSSALAGAPAIWHDVMAFAEEGLPSKPLDKSTPQAPTDVTSLDQTMGIDTESGGDNTGTVNSSGVPENTGTDEDQQQSASSRSTTTTSPDSSTGSFGRDQKRRQQQQRQQDQQRQQEQQQQSAVPPADYAPHPTVIHPVATPSYQPPPSSYLPPPPAYRPPPPPPDTPPPDSNDEEGAHHPDGGPNGNDGHE